MCELALGRFPQLFKTIKKYNILFIIHRVHLSTLLVHKWLMCSLKRTACKYNILYDVQIRTLPATRAVYLIGKYNVNCAQKLREWF